MDGSIDFIELKKDPFLLKFGIGLKKVLFLRRIWGTKVGRKFSFFESSGEWGLEESTLSSKVLGNGGWKKVRFLRKFFGNGGWKKVRFLRKFLGNGGWKKVLFLRKFWGVGFGRKFSFF